MEPLVLTLTGAVAYKMIEKSVLGLYSWYTRPSTTTDVVPEVAKKEVLAEIKERAAHIKDIDGLIVETKNPTELLQEIRDAKIKLRKTMPIRRPRQKSDIEIALELRRESMKEEEDE